MKRTKQATFAKRERQETGPRFDPVGGAQFTPGPWGVRQEATERGCPLEVIATKCVVAKVYDHHEGAANAHLIAAAPAMYEALAKLRLEAIHYRNTGVGVQFLNHAIDQAELAINQVWGEGESNYDTEREG